MKYMQSFINRLIAATLLLTAVAAVPAAIAETSVFKVSKGENSTYLLGTFHLLNASDHPLPAEFQQAYNAASSIYFEADLQAAQSPEFQMKFFKAISAPSGSTLQTLIKPETYMALEAFMAKKQMLITNFAPFSPAGSALMLTMAEYQKLGMMPEYGVDQLFFSRAQGDGKTIGHLETIDEQLSFIANLGKGQEDEMIMSTITELNTLEKSVGDLKKAWRSGNSKQLDKISLKEMREKFPDTYAEMIVNRNNKWMPEIEAMLADKPTEAVMVGALHLVGPDGLIELLKKKGYKVTQL